MSIQGTPHRATWSGVLTFGLVAAPVALIKATEDRAIEFKQVGPNGETLKQQYVTDAGAVIERRDFRKAYQSTPKAPLVLMEPEDFEDLPVPSRHCLQVTRMVPLSEIDPLYWDGSYFVCPEEGGEKALSLLIRAMAAKGLAALGKITMRTRETLAVVRAVNGALILHTCRWPDEIRQAPAIPLPEPSEQELAMAGMVLDMLAGTFAPSEYRDEYREALMERIAARRDGGAIAPAPAVQLVRPAGELMEALRLSLEVGKQAA